MAVNGKCKAAVLCAAALELFDDEEETNDNTDRTVTACVLGIAATLPKDEKAKIMGYVESIVPLYEDITFRRMFRMSKPSFTCLCSHLKDLPNFSYDHPGGKEHVTVEKQILMTLWYFGSSDTIERMADRFGVSSSTVIWCRDRVVNAINENLKQTFISWSDQQTLQQQANLFSQRNGFPGIVGALDGSHIEIKKTTVHSKSYINRKGFASLQLQAVCNYNMLFTHVFLGYPGSCHDARYLEILICGEMA